MKRRPATLFVVALVLMISALAPLSLADIFRTTLDSTDGNAGLNTITYVVYTHDAAQQRTVAVIFENGDIRERVYAYQIDGEQVTLGLKPDLTIPSEAPDDANVTITEVTVSHAQYAKSRNIIDRHLDIADTTDTPEVRFYNGVSEVLKACGMRLPYRSPYRPPNPVQWVRDIPDYNKDLMPKD